MNESSIRLLLVDDEASLREPLARHLRERHNYVVDAVSNGHEALTLLQDAKGWYDVALIDEVLETGPSGVEVLKQIKASYPQIEVILFTGWGMDNALAALQAGAFRYLAKPFHPDELAMLIRHAAEYRSLKGAVREKQILEQLLETSTILLTDQGEQEVLTRILEGIHAVGFDRVRLYLLSEDGKFMEAKAHVGMHESFIGVRWPVEDDHHMQLLLQDPRPHIFRREDGKPLPFENRLSKEDVNEWACLPLMLDGRVFGKLSADKKFSHQPITEQEVNPLTIFASQAAVAIENVRMFKETSRRANELDVLRQTALAITSPLDHDTTLQTVLQQALFLLDAKSGGIDEYDFRNNTITVVAEQGRAKDSVGKILQMGEGIAGRLLESEEPFIIVEKYSDWEHKVESYEDRQYEAVVAVPLIWEQKRIGVLYVDDELGRIFTPEDAKLLSMFADQAAIVLINSNTIHELSATKDYLDRLITSSFDGIVSVDTEGCVTGFNAKAEQILGYKAEEVLGQSVRGLYYDPEEAKRIGNLLRQAPDAKLADYLTDVKSKGGEKIPIRLSASQLFDAKEKRMGSAGYFRDLRHLQEVEMQRQQLLEASNAMSQAETLEEGLQSLSRITVESCIATFCAILLMDSENHELIVKAAYPYPRSETLTWEPKIGKVCHPFQQSETAKLLGGREPVILQSGNHLSDKILHHLSAEIRLSVSLASALIVPLEANKKHLGVCILGETRNWDRSPITDRKVELATSLMAQGAVLIEKMRLHALTQRRAGILAAMQDLALTVSSSLDLDTILQKTCQAAVDLFHVDHSGLVLFDYDHVQGKVAAEYPVRMRSKGTVIPIKGVPFEEDMINEKRPIIISDVENEIRLGPVREIMHGRFNIHSAVFVPVISNEKVLGSFSLDFVGKKRQFASEDIELCRLFAAHVASAIEKARLHEETAQRNRLLEALDEASRLIRAEKEPDKLLHQVVQISTDLMHCTASALFINYPALKDLELVAANGLPKTPLKSRLSYTSALVSQVAKTGEAQVIHNYARWKDQEVIFKAYNFKTVVAIPLKHLDDVEAVLFVADRTGSWQCNEGDLNILERFAAQASIALHASQLINKEQRRFDQLSIIYRISDYLQEARDLDKILHVVLTGVTAGYGLAFNRAAILLVDEARKNLNGGMGIGFLKEADAWKDWESHHQRGLEDFGRYLEALEQNKLDLTPIGRNIQSLQLPIAEEDEDTFSQVISHQNCIRIGREDPVNLPASFNEAFEPDWPLIIVPLMAREQVIGLLIADNKFNRSPITRADINSLIIFANTAAVAIDNVRLFRAVEMAREKIRSSFMAGNALASSQDPEQILLAIAQQAHVAASANWVTLFLIDELGQVEDFVTTGPKITSDPRDLIREDGYSMHVMQTGQVFIIRDAHESDFQVNPQMLENGVKAALCMPLTLLGKQIGVIWIHYDQPHFFHEYEIEAIQLYVNQATVAYNDARQMKELEHMRQAAQALAGAHSLNDVLEQIMQSAKDVLRGDSTAIWSYDDKRRKFILARSVKANIPDRIWKKLQKIDPDPDGTVFTIMDQGWIGVSDVNDKKRYPFLGDITRKLLVQMGVQSFQGIALGVGEEQLGVLYVNYNHRRRLNIKEREAAETFANHAAIALKKAKLLEQLGKAKKASEVVAQLMTLENKEVTLESVAQGIKSVIDCDAVVLYDYNESTNKLNHPPTMVGVRFPDKAKRLTEVEPNSVVYQMLAQNGPYIVANNETDLHFKTKRFTQEEGIKSCVAIPLIAGDRKVGVIFVNYRSLHSFTEDELAEIKLFAYQAAVAIHNAQLYEQERKRGNALQAFHQAGQVVTSSLELDKILNHIAEQAWFLVSEKDGPIGFSNIWLVQEDDRAAVVAEYPQKLENQVYRPRKIIDPKNSTDVIARVLKSQKSELINDGSDDHDDLLSHPRTHSLIAVPISLNKRTIGVIELGHPDYNTFDEKDRIALEALAAQAAIAIQNAQRFEDLKRIKGYIGSKTAVDWIQMVSYAWGHGIRREVGTARGHLKLLNAILQENNAPAEAVAELKHLENVVKNISMFPITAPLSSEDAVDSVKINELLDTYLTRQWQHDQYRPINLELDLQDGLDASVTIRASKEWLRYFFKLLVDNAVQAMLKTDRPNKRLIVTTQLVNEKVEIYIQDTGPGIPSNIVDKIFEEPIKKQVGSRGAGIGLVLARTVIETYDGTVHLFSTNNNGTTIMVTLPIERNKEPDENN